MLYTDLILLMAWYYSRLYLAASSNAGATFTENFISVPSKNGEHKTATLQDSHYVPKIAGVGNNVSVIWNGLDADDVHSVFTRHSTDSGVNFSEAQNFTRDVIPAEQGYTTGPGNPGGPRELCLQPLPDHRQQCLPAALHGRRGQLPGLAGIDHRHRPLHQFKAGGR